MDLFKKSGTMNKTLKYSYLIFLLSALTGCNTMENVYGKQHVVYNREYDYLKSTTAPNLQVPPGVDGSQLGNNYVIPGTEYPPHLQRTSMVPPGSMEDIVARGQLPASIISSNQIPNKPLSSDNSENSDNSEMSQSEYEATPASVTPELASTANVQPTTHPTTAMHATRVTIAQANPQAGLVSANVSNIPQLTIAQSANQVWNKLAPALQQAGYRVLLQDRRVNIYYILDLSATQGRVQKNTPMYQVHMTPINSRTTSLSVTDNSGEQISNKIAQRVLNDIRWNI